MFLCQTRNFHKCGKVPLKGQAAFSFQAFFFFFIIIKADLNLGKNCRFFFCEVLVFSAPLTKVRIALESLRSSLRAETSCLREGKGEDAGWRSQGAT